MHATRFALGWKAVDSPVPDRRWAACGPRSGVALARTRGLLAAALALALPVVAGAATSAWNRATADPTPASFTNTANWVGGTVPGAADTAIITNALTGRLRIIWAVPAVNDSVTFDYVQPAVNNSLFLSNADWSVTSRFSIAPSVVGRTNNVLMTSGTLNVTNASRNAVLEIGSGVGNAQFQVLGGTVNADYLVATNVGAILGAGITTKIDGGALNIHAGSTLNFTNYISSNFGIGSAGTPASLNYYGGSNLLLVSGSRGVTVGNGSILRVSGEGTVWIMNAFTNALTPSYGGSNNLFLVDNGAVATVGGLVVGSGANSHNNLASGAGSSGAVLVTNKGTLRVNVINTGTNGFGMVAVSNATLEFTANAPTISAKTAGSVALSDGTLSFAGVDAAAINGQITNVTFAGANTLRLKSATNASLSTYAFSNGAAFSTLDLAGSASLWRSTNLVLGLGGKLTGSGRVQANAVTSSGILAPGNSPGALSFSSNLTLLGTSEVVLEIGGTNAGAYDKVLVDGVLARAGTLTITNLGWVFAAGDQFDLFDFGSWSGGFALTNLPTLGGGLSWDFGQFESSGILGVVSAIPEPSAALALGSGLWLLVFLRRRRA